MNFQEEASSMGMLENLHKHFEYAGKTFKDMVCMDCEFSIPTYYRRISSPKYAKLTKAEKDRIIEIAEYIVGKINDCILLYK